MLSKESVTNTLEAVALELIQTTAAQIDSRATITGPKVTAATASNETQVSPSVNESMTIVTCATIHNESQAAPVMSQDMPKVASADDQGGHATLLAVVPSILDSSNDIHSTPLGVPEEGEIMELPNFDYTELTFSDLLRVETNDRDLMEVLHRPLSSLTTPDISPQKEGENSQAVPVVNSINSTGAPQEVVSVNITSTSRKDSKVSSALSGESNTMKPWTPNKARMDKSSKENVRRSYDERYEDRAPKRKIPVARPANKSRPKPVSWKERREVVVGPGRLWLARRWMLMKKSMNFVDLFQDSRCC